MNTPLEFTLNFRSLEWLIEEAARWQEIVDKGKNGSRQEILSRDDLADAERYLSVVRAELVQRMESYAPGGEGAAKAGINAIFESLGGSAGAGAPGAGSAISEAVSDTGAAVGSAITKSATAIYIGAFLIVALIVYLKFKK